MRRVGLRGESADSPRRLALAVSVAIHVAIVAGLGLLSLPSPPEPVAITIFVATLLANPPAYEPEARAPAEPSGPSVPDEPAVPDAVVDEARAGGESAPRDEPAPRPAEPEPAPPVEAVEAEFVPKAEPEAEAEPESRPQAEQPPAVGERDIDWALERRRAIAMLAEQEERRRGVLSFSLDDGDEPIGLPEPGPDVDIFDPGPRRGGRRPVAQVGAQRTEFARRLVKLCNELSGGGIGISLFGFFGTSVCAAPAPWADFFGHLRPDYLESLPLCTEVAASGSADAFAESGDAEPRIFCRLVPADDPARRLIENSPTTVP